MFGAANGLITITRGALPLALFGADGYGRTDGTDRRFLAGDAIGRAAGDGVRRRARCRTAPALAVAAGFTRSCGLRMLAVIPAASNPSL